jgi:beta-lactamase class A
MDAAPPLPPPAIEQPAPYQVSYGLVTGRAAAGTRWLVVSARGRVLATKPLRGRRFAVSVRLPRGDLTLRVTTVARDGRKSSTSVGRVYGLPLAARPRFVRGRNDPRLSRRLRAQASGPRGSSAFYVQNLTTGRGAAWNAKARFPAASTLKLAIAAAVLQRHTGIPSRRSYVGTTLRKMIIPSDDEAANLLEIWLAGSTSAGSARVNALMSSIGMTDSIMYGGYIVQPRSLSGPIPVRVDQQPAFGVGKYTSAADMARLHRAIWLASGNRGPLRREQPGFTAADARHLLWLLAHVRDSPKLDRSVRAQRDVSVLHKAGWVSTARHDTGLVFWRGGVFVAGVMTWNPGGAGLSADVLAGRIAAASLARFRRLGLAGVPRR